MLTQLLQPLPVTMNHAIIVRCAWTLLLVLSIVPIVTVRFGILHRTRRKLRNLQKLGSKTSNMEDQYASTFDLAPGVSVDDRPRIKTIYLHPVKSCAPVGVDRAVLTKTGFMYDRCFAFATRGPVGKDATTPRWRFISQRTKPAMSQIKTEIWLPRRNSCPHDPLVRSGGCVVISFADPDLPSRMDRLETLFQTLRLSAKPQVSFIVPLSMTAAQAKECKATMQTFAIHSRDAKGLDMGQIPSVTAALPKLKKFLGIPDDQALSLFKCTPDTLTRTEKNLAPLKYIGSPSQHIYTDQQPININSLSSVHAVSALLPAENQPLDALRFRANIWIANAPAYEEETWKRIRIVPQDDRKKRTRARIAPMLCVVCRTSRCTMPNVNLKTGTFDTENALPGQKRGKPQPSTTLVQHRTVETGNGAALGYLGMHCVPEDRSLEEAEELRSSLYVAVGDEIEILERGTHLYGSTGNDY